MFTERQRLREDRKIRRDLEARLWPPTLINARIIQPETEYLRVPSKKACKDRVRPSSRNRSPKTVKAGSGVISRRRHAENQRHLARETKRATLATSRLQGRNKTAPEQNPASKLTNTVLPAGYSATEIRDRRLETPIRTISLIIIQWTRNFRARNNKT